MTITSFKIFKQTDDRAAMLSFQITHEMDINCSFQRLAGRQCSQDKPSQAKEKCALVLPLLSRGKSISAHTQSVGVSDVESEIDLIFARASIFTAPCDISGMTICPVHPSSLGIGWWRGSQRYLAIPYRATPKGNRARLTVVLTRRFRRLSKTYQSQQVQIFP